MPPSFPFSTASQSFSPAWGRWPPGTAEHCTFAPGHRPSLLAATPEPSSSAAIEALPSIGTGPIILGSFTAAAVDSASSSLVVTASFMAVACPLAVRTPLPFGVAWPGVAGPGSTCSRWWGRVAAPAGSAAAAHHPSSSLASGRCPFGPFLALLGTDRLSSSFVVSL